MTQQNARASYQQARPEPARTAAIGPKIPQAVETEVGLINLAYRDSDCFYRLQEAGIKPEYFYNESAAHIYALLESLTETGAGKHPGKFNILQALSEGVAGVGGASQDALAHRNYFIRSTEEVVARDWFDTYLRKLVNAYKKREMIRAATELVAMAYDETIPAEACTTFAFSQTERIEGADNPLNVLDGLAYERHMRDYFNNSKDRPEASGTGIRCLDYFTGGIRLGELLMLYAEPGHGKSSLLLQAMFHRLLDQHRPQLWITIGDMSLEEDGMRFLQQQTGVGLVDLDRGEYRDGTGFDHWRQIDKYLGKIGQSHFYIHQNDKLQSSEVRRLVKSILRKEKILDVYIDHIGQFTDSAENIYTKTVNIASQMLSLAHNIKDENGSRRVSVSMISPINKQGSTEGANTLRHAAEVIWKLVPLSAEAGGPDTKKSPKEQSGYVNLVVEKGRNRGRGSVKLWFDAPLARFRSVDKDGKVEE